MSENKIVNQTFVTNVGLSVIYLRDLKIYLIFICSTLLSLVGLDSKYVFILPFTLENLTDNPNFNLNVYLLMISVITDFPLPIFS